MKELTADPVFPQVVVISLPSARKRRQHMEEQLEQHRIPFTFFDAVTREQTEEALRRQKLEVVPGSLSPSELACTMSHIAVWDSLVKSSADSVTILEDDVVLGQNAHLFLTQREWIPSPVTRKIIKLEKFQDRRTLGWISRPAHNRKLKRLKQDHFGAAAYVLGREAAAGLLEMLRQIRISRVVDHLIFDEYRARHAAAVWQLTPAVCIQDHLYGGSRGLGSDLEESRSRRLEAERQKAESRKLLKWERSYLLSPSHWKERVAEHFIRTPIPFQ